MPKVTKGKTGKAVRHNPLAEDILTDEHNKNISRNPHSKSERQSRKAGADDDEGAIPAEITKKIMEVAQAQKADEGDDAYDAMFQNFADGKAVGDNVEMEEEEIEEVEVDADGFMVGAGCSEEEERMMAMFLPGGAKKATTGQTLADVILEKIHEHEKRDGKALTQAAEAQPQGLSQKVMEVYTDIGKWMKTYKSGKLPKAFKVIPSLVNWEEVLSLTNPLEWSAAAMYEAVNVFASNLNPRMAQRFYNLVLLPAVRQNIQEFKKLNFHYYRSVKKALFKPAAFFKGIVLPLSQENCTLREAMVMCSILSKTTIPVMHASATLARLCEMTPWYGTTSLFISALLNKKYALPVRVIECMVAHFAAFRRDTTELPVVWHSSLLCFVQRYKSELSSDQKKLIRSVLQIHWHEQIGPEIRRELNALKPGEAPSTDPKDVEM